MFAHRKTGSRCRSFWNDERDSVMFGHVGALLATEFRRTLGKAGSREICSCPFIGPIGHIALEW